MRSVDIPLPMKFTSADSLNSGLPEAYFYRLAPTLAHTLPVFMYLCDAFSGSTTNGGFRIEQFSATQKGRIVVLLSTHIFRLVPKYMFQEKKDFQVHRCSMDCYQPPQLLLLSLLHLHIQLYQEVPNSYDAARRPRSSHPPVSKLEVSNDSSRYSADVHVCTSNTVASGHDLGLSHSQKTTNNHMREKVYQRNEAFRSNLKGDGGGNESRSGS